MKAYGGGLLGFFIASPSFSLITLSNVSLLRCSVSELSSNMLRGWIGSKGAIVALEVSTSCDISLPSFLMGPRTHPSHSFPARNEFGVL